MRLYRFLSDSKSDSLVCFISPVTIILWATTRAIWMDTDIFFADTVRYEYYPNIQNHLKIKLLVPYLETGFWKTIKK